MAGDPSGNDSTDGYSQMNPADRQYQGRYTAKDVFGRDQNRQGVYNDKGRQVGYTSNALPIGLGGIIGSALNGQVYTGDTRYDPINKGNNDPSNENAYPTQRYYATQQQADLASARARRANALAGQQSALAGAFGAFDDDFYGDLETSYSDYQNPLLTQGYDGSLRGIYDGFKAKGLLTQSEVDAAISGLDTSKAAEAARIGQGATEYAQAKRDEVSKKQAALGDQLSAMVGGATTVADLDAQTNAIKSFDFSKDIEKLKTPGAKGNLSFFQNYNQVAAQADPSVNVQAESVAGTPQTGSVTPVVNTGIASPFDSRSIRVV